MASTAAASDAAAAAEFASRRYVWIPDKAAGYLSAWVVREESNGETSVCSLADGSSRNVATDDLSKMNPPKFEKAEDIADLTFLNEASVVHNLKERYYSGLIYTYSGLFLVAVNPYRNLPIYTDAIIAAYKGRRREENAPHVFALADGAMRNMLEMRENQSLLVTGESGAGKTENTKKVIQYLAAVAADPTGGLTGEEAAGIGSPLTEPVAQRTGSIVRSHSSRHVLDQLRGVEALASKRLGLLERQILQANPILEAFGNAQTIRNNNSSRFGKFVRIEFTSVGAIAGANIDWYLLEKSRVTTRSDKERSFHIFYQILRSRDEGLKKALLLTSSPEDYAYLKASRKHVEGVDDTSEWQALIEALSMVGFASEEQHNLFKVIASILQVGNIELADDRSEQARITNGAQVEKACHLLGVPVQELTTALVRPRIKAGREWVAQARTRQQVQDEMAALCKTMYEKMFGTIVDRINQALDRPTSKSTFIGVLDIAGFEIFEVNSFEQLLINFTNEKLQQFFNHHMFVLEQEEYAREAIEWDFVNFGLDLQPTIDLIEATSPIGILSCLDEECIMPKATDTTFTEKLNRIWATNKDGTAKDTAGQAWATERGVAHGSTKFASSRFGQGFTVKHYAGDVEYRTAGWLERNKDPLNDNLTRVMSESSDRYIAALFSEFASDDAPAAQPQSAGTPVIGGPKRRIRKGAFRTVAQRHKEQLTSLMGQLSSTQPHFVRCIVPNHEKKPGKMDVPLVLEQLRCNGVLEGIRIARLGYPNRLLFTEFRNRYEVLTPGIIPRGYMDGRKACQRMVEALELDRSLFKVGLTKIFFKAGVLADLEERRDALLFDIFSRFQGACRMFTARRQMKKILNRAAAVRTIQRNARLYVQLREWPWWQVYTKVRPLLTGTRHDEELKRKQLELAMVKERAERDQREREALESLKHTLEADKKKVEDALEAERSLLAEKDQLLARSKERESALEEELATMQSELDQLDSQVERALASQKASEVSRAELQAALGTATAQILRLEQEQSASKDREAQITAEATRHAGELTQLQQERSSLTSESADLKRKIFEKDQDLERIQKRMNEAVAAVELRLAEETKVRQQHEAKSVELENHGRTSARELAEATAGAADLQAKLVKQSSELAELMNSVTTLTRERDALTRQLGELKVAQETLAQELKAAQADGGRAADLRSQLQKELDETRRLMDAKTSEDTKQRELHRLKEQELQSLRSELAQMQKQHADAEHTSSERVAALRVSLEELRQEHSNLSRVRDDLAQKADQSERALVQNRSLVAAAEKAQRAADGDLQGARDRIAALERSQADSDRALQEALARVNGAAAKARDFEDAMLELERGQAAWKAKADQAAVELSAESKRRELLESSSRQHERNISVLQQQHGAKDQELHSLRETLKGTQAELKTAQSMTNKTIVEHVHVLEEAKKYTDRQLAEAQSKLQELAHYTKTLEKSKTRLLTDNEDLTREVARLQQADRAVMKNVGSSGVTTMKNVGASGSTASTSSDNRAVRSLETKVADLQRELTAARRERDSAQSDSRRKDLQLDEAVSRSRAQYESRIAALERDLAGSQNARGNTLQQLSNLARQGGSGASDAFRKQLLAELQTGSEELQQDMVAKGEALRSHKFNGTSTGNGASLRGSNTGGAVSSSRAYYEYNSAAPRNGSTVTPVSAKRASLDFGGPGAASLKFSNTEAAAASQRTQAALEAQLTDAKQRLDREVQMRKDDATEKARLERQWQEHQINVASLNQSAAEARDAAERAHAAERSSRLALQEAEASTREVQGMVAARDEHIQFLEAELEALETRLLQGQSSDVSDLLEASRRRFRQELHTASEETNEARAKLQQLRDENLHLRASNEELNSLKEAYVALCEEQGVESGLIMSLQKAVERYKRVAEEHMTAFKELESESVTL
ncbi:hypothetical protein IE81DRAFT_86032 [Ceraceosorus guamensis]|uniref:Myosin II heavy chain n=1 Tax=Ceraceosorus guamensis TaxID=1522189 RepID=A0A316WC08_9BASI|nr:hypothetical protein IE81DRAFT_86032 [Ceraceosorus guamensis]PWN46171.1 hypothetical protein IE81DRAFT_86032 [Ceraceosorus guamensis]